LEFACLFNMLGKLVAMFLDKFIVHTLANNKQFQRLALKIDDVIAKNKSVLESKLSDYARDNVKSMKIKSNDAFSKIKDRWEEIKKQWIGGDN